MTLQEEVVERMAAGGSIDDVEPLIDDSALTDDMKAALWLLAWSLQPPGRARYMARQMMIMAAASEGGPVYGTD